MGLSRAHRAMTLVATVVLSLVAVTVAMVVVQQVLAAGTRSADRADRAVAERVAADTVAQFETQLANDPTFWSRELFFAERPRVCAADSQPVSANPDPDAAPAQWPAQCGQQWQYVPQGSTTTTYDPATTLARAQITAPNGTDPHLTLTVLASVGASEYATSTTYEVPSASAVTVYSGADLDLDTLAAGAPVTLAGTVYSAANLNTLTLPQHFAVTPEPLAGVRVLAECTITGPLGGAAGMWEATAAGDRTAAGCGQGVSADRSDVREVSAHALTPATANRSIAASAAAACSSEQPTLTAGTPTTSSSACLNVGRSVIDITGNLVPVTNPDASRPVAYRLRFVDVESVPAVAVDVANVALSDPSDPSEAAAAFAAGTHPTSANGVAWSPLAVVPLPATGVIATDATTYVGHCVAYFAAGECTPSAPGAPVTVIAGTPAEPANLVVAAPVSAAPEVPLGLVATAGLDLPFYATAPGAALELSAHLYAAGVGVDGASVTSRPGAQSRPALRVDGSLGADVLGPLPGWDQMTVAARDASPLPGFVAFTPYWRTHASAPLTSTQLCGSLSCANTW